MSQFQNDYLAIMDMADSEMDSCLDALLQGIKASDRPNSEVETVRLASGGQVTFVRPDPTITKEGGAFVCVFKHGDVDFETTRDEVKAQVITRFGVWPMELMMAFVAAKVRWYGIGPQRKFA